MSYPVNKLEELAEIAGVSIATVSRALSDHPSVKVATKDRIWELAKIHQFPTNRYQTTKPSSAEAIIVAIIPKLPARPTRLTDPFMQELIAHIGESARERHCDLQISYASPENDREFEHIVNGIRADGLVFIGQGMIHESLQKLAEKRDDFIVWGSQIDGQNYCTIGSDNLVGGRRATRHLLQSGRKKIVFMGDISGPEMRNRYNGYALAHEEAGMELTQERFLPSHLDIGSAASGVQALKSNGVDFDAIVAVNDVVALGAIKGLRQMGLRVPEDVAVVGYDNLDFGQYSHPALTSISQNIARGGRMIVSKLFNGGLNNMLSEKMPTDLIVRDSCGTN